MQRSRHSRRLRNPKFYVSGMRLIGQDELIHCDRDKLAATLRTAFLEYSFLNYRFSISNKILPKYVPNGLIQKSHLRFSMAWTNHGLFLLTDTRTHAHTHTHKHTHARASLGLIGFTHIPRTTYSSARKNLVFQSEIIYFQLPHTNVCNKLFYHLHVFRKNKWRIRLHAVNRIRSVHTTYACQLFSKQEVGPFPRHYGGVTWTWWRQKSPTCRTWYTGSLLLTRVNFNRSMDK